MAFESTLKYSFSPKEVADKKAKERKINLILLIQHYLKSEGYVDSYTQFLNEAKLPKEYELCDNMELYNILQDYETFYYIRFQKYPKLSKKGNLVEASERNSTVKLSSAKKVPNKTDKKENLKENKELSISGLTVLPISPEICESNNDDWGNHEKLFKPLGSFEGYSDEWKSMADVIIQEIVENNLNVKWNDIVGLEDAKQLLKEALVYPMKYPQLYKGTISPWKGILLYGPSGTGKTLLAKAAASECKSTFFNISASSIVSKWRGESEKLIRVMFDLARLQAPSTIFVDELDAIGSRRDMPHEHEASRRLKSELLIQLDGLCQTNGDVFFLTTSNLPWDLDVAILRRLEKRILIGLPELKAREELIKMYLPPTVMDEPLITAIIDYKHFAEKCQGYSGSDIKLLCKEVSMSAMRNVFNILENNSQTGSNLNRLKLKPISNEDFECALHKVKSFSSSLHQKYLLWAKDYGSG